MRARSFIRELPIQVFLIIWSLIVLVPFALIALLAFRSQQDIFLHPLGLGGKFILNNFVEAWEGPPGSSGLSTFLQNSVIVAVIALATSIFVGAPAAYFATRLGERIGRYFIRLLLLASVVPLVLLVVPYYQIFDFLNALNNPVALGFVYGVITLPTTVLILIAFFREFPPELTEAAAIDGLSNFTTFLRIVLPLSRGAITGVALLALVFVWGEAQLGVPLLQDSQSQTVSVGVLGFQGQFSIELGPTFALLAIASVPIIAVYLIFNRAISKGIALGGVFR